MFILVHHTQPHQRSIFLRQMVISITQQGNVQRVRDFGALALNRMPLQRSTPQDSGFNAEEEAESL